MLVSLEIENFALIDRLHLDFEAGLNVLTGETGAGKSIILDAIDAVLGGRVSQRMVRTGEKRACLEATFQTTPAVMAWLREQEVPVEGDRLVCTRELTAGRGTVRSRSRLNGHGVNKPLVEALRLRLVEITAQGQTLQVGDPILQLDWLDSVGGKAIAQQRQVTATVYTAAAEAHAALDRRRRAEAQRQEQLDLFSFQAEEFSQAALEDPEEMTRLEQERQRLAHAVELQQQSYQVYQVLYENDQGAAAGADLLGQAVQTLEDMLRYDPTVEPILGYGQRCLGPGGGGGAANQRLWGRGGNGSPAATGGGNPPVATKAALSQIRAIAAGADRIRPGDPSFPGCAQR
jgi:DNA repair protein RecN (Recombination protein N)